MSDTPINCICCTFGVVYVNENRASSKCDQISDFLKKHWKWAIPVVLIVLVSVLIALLVKTEGESPSQSTTSTPSPSPPINSPILTIWDSWGTKALVTNSNGDVGDIKWGKEGAVSGWTYCAIEHRNQFFLLGQESRLKITSKLKGPDPFSLTQIVRDSNYEHHATYVASSNNFVLAVGSCCSSSGNAETELLSVETWLWSTKASYPYEKKIWRARTLHYNDNFYLFGGYNDNGYYLSRIASYSPSTNTWSSRGYLLTPRYYAGVIWAGDAFIIVGGWMSSSGQKSSERCHFSGSQIKCAYQNPTEPSEFTHLFHVSSDYCSGAITEIISVSFICSLILLQLFQT